jgi:hypothetical protein
MLDSGNVGGHLVSNPCRYCGRTDVHVCRPPKLRSKGLRPRTAKRQAKQPTLFGKQADLCRLHRCCACHERATHHNPIEPHHEPSIARGGTDEDTCPLCHRCHSVINGVNGGRAELERRHRVDLLSEVRKMRRLVKIAEGL